MTDMNESGKKSKVSPLPEEEIIELTEILGDAMAEDDDIIELTDIIAEPQSDEEEIIELKDIVEAPDDIIELTDLFAEDFLEPKETVDQSEEDEIIELAEVAEDEDFGTEDDVIVLVDESPVLADTLGKEADTLGKEAPSRPAPSAQPIPIELEDTVGFLSEEDVALERDAIKTTTEPTPEIDNELIELIESADGKDLNALLDDVAKESTEEIDSELQETDAEADELVQLEGNLLEVDEALDLTEEEGASDELEEGGAFADSLGVDLVSALSPSDKQSEIISDREKVLNKPGIVSIHVQDKRPEGKPIDFKFESRLHPGEELYREKYVGPDLTGISHEDLEKALEKVVREMFAEKIERMLTDVVQKVVTEEIRKIKSILLED